MTNEELADHFTGRLYYSWFGPNSYDTRPYVRDGGFLPVANQVSSLKHSHTCNAGDVEGFLRALPDGSQVVEPDYYGSQEVGRTFWVKSLGVWKSHYESDE